MAQASSATVAVGASLDMEAQVTDLWGYPIDFAHISITQFEISAAQLINTDSVRVRLYRVGTRREPADLVVDFDGTSQLTGIWYSSFTDRRIEYSRLGPDNKVYLTVRNTAGNSGPSTFQLILYGRRFPSIRPVAWSTPLKGIK
jgi:hypothetical protein